MARVAEVRASCGERARSRKGSGRLAAWVGFWDEAGGADGDGETGGARAVLVGDGGGSGNGGDIGGRMGRRQVGDKVVDRRSCWHRQ